jgi:hypothetical protein
MKSGYKLAVLFLLSSITQPDFCVSQVLMLGLKAGAGWSSGDYYKNGKMGPAPGDGRLMNFNGGLILNLKIRERWYLHSEILFEDKGIKKQGSRLVNEH